MNIIDMRMFPPYGNIRNSPQFIHYDAPGTRAFRSCMRLSEEDSIRERSMEKLLNDMDALHVERASVVCRTSSKDDITNDDVAALLHEYPDRFVGFPHIDPADGKNALEEIEHFVLHGPCTGIYMEPGFRLARIPMHGDDSRIFPVYELCQDKQIPVILQYGGGVNSTEYYTPSDIDRIMAAFPRLTLAIAHGGWPQVMPFCHLAYRHNNVYLLTDCYFTGYPGSRDYVEGANGILQDKILFGSSYPGYPLNDAVRKYVEAGLHNDVLQKVMHDNATRFLGMESSEVTLADSHVGFEK